MAVTTTKTNKPLNPRGNDQSPKGYNRASLFSGKALDFDGVNDYVDLDGFTMTGNVATIVFSTTFENNNYFFDINAQRFVITNTANDGFRVYNSNAWASYGDTLRDEIGFYAVVSDGTTQRVYYNGHQLGSDQTITALNWSSATQIKIGSHNGGGTNFFNGQLSGFKIFNTALTAAQVADLYNNPEKIVPTGVSNDALKLWLPMMEGAGTTAYDGSGNGNHGTISGATWTHGVGSPVAQTAVIDWNKAKNDAGRSQEFDNAYWGKGGLIVTANATTAPDGTQTADKLAAISTANSNAEIYRAIGFTANNAASVFVKSDTAQWVTLGTNRTLGRVVFFDIINGVVGTESTGYTGAITEYLNGWYKLDVYWDGTATTQAYWDLSIADADNAFGVTAGKSIFAWGAYANLSDTTIGPYIATLTDSAITSPVLLPQGLTSGRDITGVNLFENVRKQGALNLDGNSWAEVHDNASVDLTDNLTLEAWVYLDETSGGGKGILGKWYYSISKKSYLLYLESNHTSVGFYVSSNGSGDSKTKTNTTMSNGNWYHVAGVYDGSNISIYLNGSLETSLAFTSSLYTSDKDLQIGILDSNTTQEYENQIAQPRIYNRALTAEEVERNYNAGKNIYK